MVGMSASVVGMGLRLLPNPKTQTFNPKNLTFNPKTQSSFLSVKPTLRKPTLRVAAAFGGSNVVLERAISAASYVFPLLNTLQYGRRLFALYPAAAALVLDPLLPLVSLYRSIPYGSFIGFLVLYVGVARNPAAFTTFARFNAMQAVILDVVLVLGVLLARFLSPRLLMWAQDGVFVLSCLCCAYGVVNCVIGKMPYLPLVGKAASSQLN